MSAFGQQVADREFNQLDREFAETARKAGYEPVPADEIIAIQEGRRVPSATQRATRPARPFRTPIPPGRETPREEREPTRAGAGASARKRDTIRINVAVEPIYIEDAATGEEFAIPLRRVPSLQHGYVDAAWTRVERARNRKNALGRTSKDMRQLDIAVGEYNDAIREFLDLQVDYDMDALFAMFDIAELDACITILAERNSARRARPQAGSADGVNQGE